MQMTPVMKVEWEAWQDVVSAWPDDINETEWKGLLASIKVWGERLAALRSTQSDMTQAVALNQALDAFEAAYADNE